MTPSKIPTHKRFDIGRWAIALMAILFLPTACASGEQREPLRVADAGVPDTSVRVIEPRPGKSVSGNYLAARHAQVQRDLGQAADYLLEVLAADPKNPDLLRSAMMILSVDGRMDDALRLAERLLAVEKDNPMAHIMLATRAMKAGRPAEAETHAAGLPANGISAVVGPLARAWAIAAQNKVDDALAALAPLSANRGATAMRQLHVALINQVGGRLGPAEAAFRETMTDPETLSLRQIQMLGALLESSGRNAEAEALYTQ